MLQQSYHFEIKDLIASFIDAFDGTVIRRFNKNRSSESQIKVRYLYAPKQRVLFDIVTPGQNLTLPVVAITITGLNRDENRVFNKIAGTYNEVADGRFLNEKQPLPIDLTVNVSVMTRYQADMDQILSHLLPYINPYFVVSWRTPSRPDFEIRSNVYWNGTANIQYPTDLNSTQVARVVADLSFVFKGWIFQALPNDVIGSVYSINSTYALSNNLDYSISYDQFKLDMLETDSNYDQITYQGTPPQPTVIEPSWGNTGKN